MKFFLRISFFIDTLNQFNSFEAGDSYRNFIWLVLSFSKEKKGTCTQIIMKMLQLRKQFYLKTSNKNKFYLHFLKMDIVIHGPKWIKAQLQTS